MGSLIEAALIFTGATSISFGILSQATSIIYRVFNPIRLQGYRYSINDKMFTVAVEGLGLRNIKEITHKNIIHKNYSVVHNYGCMIFLHTHNPQTLEQFKEDIRAAQVRTVIKYKDMYSSHVKTVELPWEEIKNFERKLG